MIDACPLNLETAVSSIERRLSALQRFVDRPGTAGEVAAGQAAIDRIKAVHFPPDAACRSPGEPAPTLGEMRS